MLCPHVVPSCCTCMLCLHVVHGRCDLMLCMDVVPSCCAWTLWPHVVHARYDLTLCMHVVPSCCHSVPAWWQVVPAHCACEIWHSIHGRVNNLGGLKKCWLLPHICLFHVLLAFFATRGCAKWYVMTRNSVLNTFLYLLISLYNISLEFHHKCLTLLLWTSWPNNHPYMICNMTAQWNIMIIM